MTRELARQHANQITEAVLIVVFIIVSAVGSLYLLDLIKLTPEARLWAGRLLGAFALLALFYLSYQAHRKEQ